MHRKIEKLKDGDVFDVFLNPESQRLTFTSVRFGTSKTLPVLHTAKNKCFDSVIVIGMESADSEVEIVLDNELETKKQQN